MSARIGYLSAQTGDVTPVAGGVGRLASVRQVVSEDGLGAVNPGIRHVGRWRAATCRIFHDLGDVLSAAWAIVRTRRMLGPAEFSDRWQHAVLALPHGRRIGCTELIRRDQAAA